MLEIHTTILPLLLLNTIIFSFQSCSTFVSVYSSLQEPPSCAVFQLSLINTQQIPPSQIRTLLEVSGQCGIKYFIYVCILWEHCYFNYKQNYSKIKLATVRITPRNVFFSPCRYFLKKWTEIQCYITLFELALYKGCIYFTICIGPVCTSVWLYPPYSARIHTTRVLQLC
jgi:hypothetical protein